MIEKIISGGQTGADVAGLRAAKALGIPTGGWMAKGFRTLDGPRPEYENEYGIKQMSSVSYPLRTAMNVINSDCTFQFATNWNSPGEKLTTKLITINHKPHLRFQVDRMKDNWIEITRDYLEEHEVKILNIAGNSERTSPGIEDMVFNFLLQLHEGRSNGGV